MKDVFQKWIVNLKNFNVYTFVKSYKYTILFSLFLFVIAYFQMDRLYGKNILGVVSVILAMCLFAKNKYLQVLSFFLIIPLAFDAYFAFVYGQGLSTPIVASIMETNTNEAKGMLSEAIIPALLILCVIIVLLTLSNRELRRNKIPCWFLLSYFTVIFLVVMPIHVHVKYKKDKAEGGFKNSLGTVNLVKGYFSYTLVMGEVFILMEYILNEDMSMQFRHGERILPEGITLAEDMTDIPEKLFIIIGEASSRNHYSLYGYERGTTPFLDRMKAADSLIYQQAVSPACFTREAVPMSMSFAEPVDQDLFFTQMNVVDLAKNNGYETVWISVQEPSGFGETCVGYLASTADTTIYKKERECKYLLLIPHLLDLLKEDKKQCFILHTFGGHAPYDAQISKEEKKLFRGKTKTDIYDATVWHTDKFLEKLYNIVSSYPSSALFYYSDHGELPESGGHGMRCGGRKQYEIPMIAINRSKIPMHDIFKKYVDPATGLINSNNNIYLLSEIMGYKVSDDIIKKAVKETNTVLHEGKVMTLDEVEKMKK